MKMRLPFQSLPLILIYLPVVILVFMLGSLSFSWDGAFLKVLVKSLAQSALSASFAVLLGFFGALGLLHREGEKFYRWLEMAYLLPNFAPPVFVIVAAFSFLGPALGGLWGVVLLHGLINVGLVSLFLKQAIRAKVTGWAQLSRLEGASAFTFWSQGGLWGLKRDLFYSFLFVFALAFTSFSVPMALGASDVSLEIYIFELLRLEGERAAALGVGLAQTFVFVVFAFFLPRQAKSGSAPPGVFPRSYGLSWGAFLPLVPVAGIVISMASSWWSLPEFLQVFEGAWPALGSAVAGSLIVGLSVGWLTLLLLLWVLRFPPEGGVRRILLGTVSPSAALLGMVMLFVFPVMNHGWDFVRISLSLTLLFFPTFYRLEMDGVLQDLRHQRSTASLLGAAEGLTFRQVILPQALRSCSRMAAVASLWAWGDFAVTNLVSSERKTVGALLLSLMESYRFEVASLLLTLLLLGGLLTFAFFIWVGNVFPSESKS